MMDEIGLTNIAAQPSLVAEAIIAALSSNVFEE